MAEALMADARQIRALYLSGGGDWDAERDNLKISPFWDAGMAWFLITQDGELKARIPVSQARIVLYESINIGGIDRG